MNGELFKRIESLYQNAPELNPESQRLLERYREDYRRAGANLSKAVTKRSCASSMHDWLNSPLLLGKTYKPMRTRALFGLMM